MTNQSSKARPLYFLALLTFLNIILVMDKTVLTVMLEPIKSEFGLTDLQLGLLTGTVYAISSGIGSIPLGGLVDRVDRRRLTAVCVTIWSLATAMGALSRNFAHLLLARIVVGTAEAGGGPAALSLISDLFDRRVRATAMAVYASAVPLVVLINLVIVTGLVHAYGWRVALICCSVPGLVLAALIVLTVREPARRNDNQQDGAPAGAEKAPETNFKQAVALVFQRKSLFHLMVGTTLSYLALAGTGAWIFSFLARSRGLALHEVGWQIAVVMSICGILGTLIGGWAVDRLRNLDERWSPWAIAGINLVLASSLWMLTAVSSWIAVLVALGLLAAVSSAWMGPTYALCQSLVGPKMRGKMSGVLFFLMNVVGYGLGPVTVGLVSDLLHPTFGDQALRYAILGTTPLLMWSALHFVRLATTVRRDLLTAEDLAAPAT